MEISHIVALGVVAVLLVVVYNVHTRIITTRNDVDEGLSSVDVQLRKRHDLIPNVVATARQFMAHEQTLLNSLTELRAKAAEPYDRSDTAAVRENLDREAALQSELDRFRNTAEA